MFCPPQMRQKIRERKLNRRNRRQQLKARQEAVAAGWNNNVYDDDSSDESLENEHNLWTTTSLEDFPALQTDQSEDYELLVSRKTEPEQKRSTSDSVVDIQVKSFSSLQVFSANYFIGQQHPSLQATSGSSAADDERHDMHLVPLSQTVDDEEGEDAIDDTALENKEELYAILEELQRKSLEQRPKMGDFDPTLLSTTEPTEATESETTTTVEWLSSEAPPLATPDNDDSNAPDAEVRSESSDGEGSDEDSLDLGVISSVWQRSKEKEADLAATNSVQKLFMQSAVSALSSTTIGGVANEAMEDEHSLDGSLEEDHEGAEVFLLTEGLRYSGPQNDETSSKLLRFRDPATPQQEKSQSTLAAMLMQGAEDYKNPSQLFTSAEFAFSPRLYSDEDDSEKWEDLKFGTPGSSRASVHSLEGGSAKSVHTMRSAFSAPTLDPLTSHLASMIAPLDLSLFEESSLPDERADLNASFASFASDGSQYSIASCPVQAEASSILRQDMYAMNDTGLSKYRRSKLSSSFKSSTMDGRVAYSLSRGKRSMNKAQRMYSKSFLPKSYGLPQNPHGKPRRKSSKDRALSVLLVEMSQQIFEVVEVDIQQDTTIGDLLSKARSASTDASLSEQKYLSLVCGSKEYAAPMLPVNLVVDWEKHKSRPLVVAVPEGSTGSEMRSVKRVLWKNPKTKRWWEQDDPFMPKMEEEVNPELPIPECVEVEMESQTKIRDEGDEPKEETNEPQTVSSFLDHNDKNSEPNENQATITKSDGSDGQPRESSIPDRNSENSELEVLTATRSNSSSVASQRHPTMVIPERIEL